jgi:hypothetical protein
LCRKTHVRASYAILRPFGVRGRHQKFENHRRDQFRHDRDGGFARVSLIWRSRRQRSMNSDYVFSPMCRFSFRPKSYACPHFSSVASMLPRLARIFGFWPFSVGHPDSVVSIESFDRERPILLSRSPRTILILTSRRGAGATSPTCRSGQGGLRESEMWPIMSEVDPEFGTSR